MAEYLLLEKRPQSMCLLLQRGVSASLFLTKLETCLLQGHLPLTTQAMCSVIEVSSTKKQKQIHTSFSFSLLCSIFWSYRNPTVRNME